MKTCMYKTIPTTTRLQTVLKPHDRTSRLRAHASRDQTDGRDCLALSRRHALLGGACAAVAPSLLLPRTASADPDLGFESRVSEFTLQNGLHFLAMERRNAPVVSCHTHARVGAWVEDPGSTGLAHLMEHCAFKGTPRIGSTDWPRERAVLAAQDELFYELRELRRAAGDVGASSSRAARIQQLQEQLQQLKAQGEELVVPNAFGSMLQEAGAVGLNAATSHDNTRYFVSLPSNKLELWFALEAERFQVPVLRELYTEKEVIEEERRMRYENSPLNRFTSDFLLAALDNPYRRPVIGFASDFDSFGSREVTAFYNKYYHPSNLTISIVGDVDPGQVQQMAQRYFGSWAAAPGAITLDTSIQQLATEPLPQPAALLAAADQPGNGTSSSGSMMRAVNVSQQLAGASAAAAGGGGQDVFVQRSAAGPLLALGYFRPSLTGRRGTALEVAADILSGGRSSRLIQQLVMRNKCLSASCLPGYPGELHPGLVLVSAVPQPGGDLQQLAGELQQQLDRLCEDGPTPQELSRVKAGARAALLGALTSNSSMAAILAAYHAVSGSWRGVLQELADVEVLTGQEVAAEAAGVFGSGRPRFTGMALPLL